jgi:hypothetical protein
MPVLQSRRCEFSSVRPFDSESSGYLAAWSAGSYLSSQWAGSGCSTFPAKLSGKIPVASRLVSPATRNFGPNCSNRRQSGCLLAKAVTRRHLFCDRTKGLQQGADPRSAKGCNQEATGRNRPRRRRVLVPARRNKAVCLLAAQLPREH